MKSSNLHFGQNETKFTRISCFSSSKGDPNGAFQCKNVKCKLGGQWQRYLSKPSESIPDVLPCPSCRCSMMNYGLNVRWGDSLSKIKQLGAGTPEIYESALQGLRIFKRLYDATLTVEKIDQWPAPEVPSLDVILDIAPCIFDLKTLRELLTTVSKMNLSNYSPDQIIEKMAFSSNLKSFYDSLPISTPQKQTELCQALILHEPSIQNPTWVFYIWSKFNLVKRTKERNHIWLEKSC